MSLAPPTLHNRSFEELVDEARRRIGRYTPEYSIGWDDHNESDPGITLVQILAWLAATTAERVNTLPDRAYRSMLDTLGLDVRPAVPAEADLVFEAVPGTTVRANVRKGSRVGAPPAPDGSPIVFETQADLDLIRGELVSVLTFDGRAFQDVTGLNEPEGNAILPFGDRPETGAALYFGFDSKLTPGESPFPGKIPLRAFESPEPSAPSPIACGDAPQSTRADMVWQYLPKQGDEWKDLQVYSDATRALEVSGYLELEGPAEIERAAIWTLEDPLFWLRLRVSRPDYGKAVPKVAFFRFNGVLARHEVTYRNEMVGTSDGARDQRFELKRRPVVPESLELYVDGESGEPEPWTEVRHFLPPEGEDDETTGPDARVYTLDPATGEVRFGDGYRAAIPSAGGDIVARRYRFGGGSNGNLEAGSISAIQTTLAGVKSAENPVRSLGGRDAQSVPDALGGAPQWLRRRERAVTGPDYEAAAREIGGVALAKALSGVHPDYPGIHVPGAVTVLIVQDTEQRSPPEPTEDLMRVVCRHLHRQRMLTVEVFVASPQFWSVEVDVLLRVDPSRSLGAAQEAAREALALFLAPETWPFGRALYPANLLSELLTLPDDLGIRAAEDLRIEIDGRLWESATEPIELPDDTLVYPGRHSIRAEPDSEA